jgi:hypothetical protein
MMSSARVDFVAEYVPTGAEPDGTDRPAQPAYWVAINSQRWEDPRLLEQQTGLAVCDSDPLKLHYSWCLSSIGAAPRERFELELAQVGEAFAAGTLGLRAGASGNCLPKACRQTFPSRVPSGQTSPCSTH